MNKALPELQFETMSLHETIALDRFDCFTACLRRRGSADINQPNAKGETPLLTCLKLGRSIRFILVLLRSGCDVNVADKYGITPLYAALKDRRYNIVLKLLKRGAEISIRSEIIGDLFMDELRTKNWRFMYVLIRYKKDFVFSYFSALKELKPNLVFRNEILEALIQLDRHLSENPYTNKLNYVGENLVRYIVQNEECSMFETVWFQLNHKCICSRDPAFLKNFLDYCCYSSLDFTACLSHILYSSFVEDYFTFYRLNIYESFYCDLLKACANRNVDNTNTYSFMFTCFVHLPVTSCDVLAAYRLCGINFHTSLLLEFLDREILMSDDRYHKFAFELLKSLEEDVRIEVDGVNKLGLMAKRGISVSKNWFDKTLYENIYLKRFEAPTRKVPSLLNLCNRPAQIHIQNAFKIKNPDHFENVITDLCIPRVLKKALCSNIPICYNKL